ncbi:MAG: OmpA family protein [Betaproteobacteria bacterium]|nr:OmpA family protein [Betaproteobacteria bacterium]
MISLRACIAFIALGLMVQTGWAAEDPEPIANPKLQILDLVYKVEDIGGKVMDLQLKETDTEIRIELAADVLFDFDKADIRREAQNALKQVGAIIKEKAKGTVRIEGHTDSKGSDGYNQKLSERRANSVRDWLVKNEGLKNVRFSTTGFGAKKPAVSNTKPDGADDPAGRQKNRRVEIVIGKKK